MDYFTASLSRYGNIQCLFLKNMSDRRIRRLARQADLVVVILHQDAGEVREYFEKHSRWFGNCVYILNDYLPEKDLSIEELSRKYRIDQMRIACVPYNTAYQEAVRTGTQDRYLRSEQVPCLFQAHMDFRKELVRTVRKIRKALEYSAL